MSTSCPSRVKKTTPCCCRAFLSVSPRVWLSLILHLLPLLSCNSNKVVLADANENEKEKNTATLTVQSLSDSTKRIDGQVATAFELAATLAGPGLTILNATFVTGGAKQFGTFDGGLDSIGIDKGVVLSTGDVADIKGPNNSGATTTVVGGPGYKPLEALVLKDVVLSDAAVLEIKFECTTGSLNNFQFSYLFASEEYNELVDGIFNDVFAFFLNGYETTNNIATLSDGTAVAINSVNCGKEYNPDAGGFCFLYVNNEDGIFDTQMDGFTAPLDAKAKDLGTVNVITIAITDAGDGQFDSAVFLEAGSLSCKTAGPTPPPTKAPTPGPTAAPTPGTSAPPAPGPNSAEGPTQAPTKMTLPSQQPTAGTPQPTQQPTQPSTTRPPTMKPTAPTLQPTAKPSNSTKGPTQHTKKPAFKPNQKTTKPTHHRHCTNGLKLCLRRVRRICDCDEFCCFNSLTCPNSIVDNWCPCLKNMRRDPQAFNRGRRSILKKYKRRCRRRCPSRRGVRRRATVTRQKGEGDESSFISS